MSSSPIWQVPTLKPLLSVLNLLQTTLREPMIFDSAWRDARPQRHRLRLRLELRQT